MCVYAYMYSYLVGIKENFLCLFRFLEILVIILFLVFWVLWMEGILELLIKNFLIFYYFINVVIC